MAAGQQKKRLSSPSVMRFNVHEQRTVKKKKKFGSPDNVVTMRSHVSLAWDDNQKRAVAKMEQVGIMWRDMAPFVSSIPPSHASLADVFSVPQEIFGLENITEVLSCEVWETCLSETERKFLLQFLPCGNDADQVLQSLLMGENFHFGNPFHKWGSSLCAGKLHPDAILHRSQHLKAIKKTYYSDLKNYHDEIIENLTKWKERWTSCQNSEKDIKEMWRKGIKKNGCRNLQVSSERAKVVRSSKEKTQKNCIRCGDTTDYMSYMKISRKQLEVIKNIEHSGDGVPSKSLKFVLGDIKVSHIRPYEDFEEEEMKRLHEHWLKLASKDLPAAFADHRKWRSLRAHWRKSVDQELAEKKNWMMKKDEAKQNLECSFLQQVDEESEHLLARVVHDGGDVDSTLHFTDNHQLERVPSLNRVIQDQGDPDSTQYFLDSEQHLKKIPSLNSSVDLDQVVNQDIFKSCDTSPALPLLIGCTKRATDFVESESSQADSRCLERVPSVNSHQEISPMVVDQEGNQGILTQTDNSPFLSQCLGNMNPTEDIMELEASTTSSKDIWPSVDIQNSCYRPVSEGHEYTSAAELSLRQPQAVERSSIGLIDSETNILNQEATVSVSSALHMDSRASMFNSYANQDGNAMIPAFSEAQGMLPSYPQGHLHKLKQPELQYPIANGTLLQSNQFSHHFHGQQQVLLGQRQDREKDLYIPQMMSANVYSNGGNPSQVRFPSHGPQEWAIYQSHVNGALMSPDWLLGEYRAHNGWSNAEASVTAVPCSGNSSNADGSLLSVISKCEKPPSHLPNMMPSSERILQTGSFVSGGVLSDEGIYTFPHHQLYNAIGRDAATKMSSNMEWGNVPHPNSGLQDIVGKTFLRSRNQ